MTPDPERLFRRYQETRDPEWIGRVFDALAPTLLRLAIHLVGRAGEAEDLVQETFLVALERADEFDASRELAPWLAGILANRARDARRRGAREPDPERLRARLAAAPDETAQEAELSGALAQALDRLEEPYRRALVLRLRHGMSPADVAHVLGESPGAVRVRLHRGLEKLRALLPASLASALAVLVGAGRGLAAVRAEVVARAGAGAAAVPLSIGGLVMTKKLLLGAAALAAIVAISAWAPWKAAVAHDPRPGEPARPVLLESDSPTAEAEIVDAPAAAEVEASRTAASVADPQGDLVALRGRVVDGATGDPVAGARVELHEPVRRSMRRIKQEIYELTWHDNRSLLGSDTWELSRSRSFGDPTGTPSGTDDEPRAFYGRLAPGSATIASAFSDEAGEFELPAPPSGGTLRCAREGFAERTLPAPDPTNEWTIELRPARRLAGHVVDARGERLAETVTLVFWGEVGRRRLDEAAVVRYYGSAEEAARQLDGEVKPMDWSAHDAWSVVTEPDGTFATELPAARVQVVSRTPGYVCRGAFDTGTGEPALVWLERVPVLVVADAATGEGIEHFAMVGREASAANPRWAGRFYAPAGRYTLFRDGSLISMLRRTPFDLTVWAEGYLPRSFHFTDLPSQEVVEAALEPGELPAITGLVLENGAPLAGVLVELQPYYPLQWRVEGECSVDACRTDRNGRFRLAAPEGSYLLRAEHEERLFVHAVELPHGADYVIDFAHLGSIEVTLRDAAGTPQLGHTVVLGDASGRSEWRWTDGEGRVVFRDLADATYTLAIPHVPTRTSFSDAIREEVLVAAGSHERLTVMVPTAGEPRFARVVTEPTTDLAGWRARTSTIDWVALEPEGTIPIDLQKINLRDFEVAAPDGRCWTASVPTDAEDGHPIRVVLDGARYEGVLLDLSTDAPLVGVRVSAAPAGMSSFEARAPSAVTDEVGRFTLVCEHDVPHRITFNDHLDRHAWENFYGAFAGVFFVTEPPSEDPEPFTIRVPRGRDGVFRGLGAKTLRGHVVDASGRPAPQSRVAFTCLLPQPAGTVELRTQSAFTLTDAQGDYELLLPDTPQYRTHVYPPGENRRALTDLWDAQLGTDEVRDFELP